jgi:adenine-specific DNA-methyltransferase
MAFRFLGNKAKLLPYILQEITSVAPPAKRPLVADLFCGTATVSAGLKKLGYRVIANDLLLTCSLHAKAQLRSPREPEFEGLSRYSGDELTQISTGSLFPSRYGQVLSLLNSLPGMEGFFFREYSPEGRPANGAAPRRYFTPDNARRIDSIRTRIKDWFRAGLLSETEHALLLHDLMMAANEVANTAGTYGHFLSHMSESALQPLKLTPTALVEGPTDHIVLNKNAVMAARDNPAEVYYLDPPYTKRQYAAYYHVLETIAHEDEPELEGKSGLRPWEDRASDFCYKQRAPKAMRDLLSVIDARYIFVSYSGDGHIKHEEMMDLLGARAGAGGDVKLLNEVEYQRYTSKHGVDDSLLNERLYRVKT